MKPPNESIRVLQVDDDPDLADMAGTFLKREDDRFDIETAPSASEGLDRLARGDFDCVVSDYDMPGQNGIEFLRRVREEYPDLPFILYTGKGSEAVASDAISAGVTDYLQKQSGTSQYTVLANRIRNAVDSYRAKTELADREKRLNLFFEESPMGVVEWDENFDLIRLNDTAEEILGYDEAELVGESWESIVPESDRNQVQVVVSDLLEAEGGHHSINENIRKDGRHIVCEWHNRVVTDENDEVITIFSSFQEITDQVERERELERYEAYLEESTDIITVIDESGVIEYQSPSATRILGYEPGELVGQNGFDLVHPDDVDEVWETFTDVLSVPGETLTAECRLRTADDEWCWIEIRGTNQLDNDAIEGVVTNNRDITERKEREQALRREREITQQALDTLTEIFYIFGPDGKLRRWNDRVAEVTRYSDEELASMDALDFFPEDEREHIADIIEETLSTGTATAEADALTKDGERIPYEFTGARLTDADGQLIGIVGIGRDISERKRRETELERKNERLEEFASLVSHDLHNPLNVAQGRLELALEECDSEHLDSIDDALDRCQALIDDLLTLAREGKKVNDIETVDLGTLVGNCWHNVETGEATITVETDQRIRADKNRLQQLLENLYRNAIEHGGDNVGVIVGDLPDGFYIEDDGPGIPADERDDVFDIGYSTAEEGTGFGLRIVQQIIDAHSWDIRVTDSSEGGARFEITSVEFPT